MIFSSTVIKGDAHGRTIGYPTANLKVTEEMREAFDRDGVYAVRAEVRNREYAGALFWGKRALFEDYEPVCEVVLVNFSEEIYNEPMRVEVCSFIRPSVRVRDDAHLKQLISSDIERAERILSLTQKKHDISWSRSRRLST